jgi:hypothetical protein
MQGEQGAPPVGGRPDAQETVYSVVAVRRTTYDTLMWQVPALGLTAQAFLRTVAFGPDSSDIARYLTGGLSIVLSLVAIQTMLKHRANERTDSMILEEMEREMGVSFGTGGRPHAAPRPRGRAAGNDWIDGCWEHRKSANLWVASLLYFALAGLTAMVMTLVDPAALAG